MTNPTAPIVAIVIAGGQVQEVILENWQAAFVVSTQFLTVDYDSHKYPDSERVPIPYGQNKLLIGCQRLIATVIGPNSRDVLTPSRVLAAKEAFEQANGSALHWRLQALQRQMLAYSDAMDAAEHAPDGNDYHELYSLVMDGLSRLQADLPTPSGEGSSPDVAP